MTLSDLQKASVGPTVASALAEDIGSGDLTAALVNGDAVAGATIIAREPLVLAGQDWATEVFRQVDENIILDWYLGDGQRAGTDDVICKLVGPAQGLLSGERTALNFIQTLSATATLTAQYVDAIKGSSTRILDTRKTIPGLRLAQKYAVRCGGGHNHRFGLFDAILLKENHIMSAGSIAAALQRAQATADDVGVEVEIEVESLDELAAALDAGASRIMLDNFSLDALKAAVKFNQEYGRVVAKLEASGDITLHNIRDVAESGVDFISIGALTKNIRAADFSMLFKLD